MLPQAGGIFSGTHCAVLVRRARVAAGWCLAGIVLASACTFGSEALRIRGDIEACDREIREHPEDPQWHQRRGELMFFAGRAKDSLAEFDRVVELLPEREPYHWQRGISCYYAEEFAKGRLQFERHRAVNRDDVENAAWHFFCVARADGVAAACRTLMALDPARDGRVPMAEIYALLRGVGTEGAVIEAARMAPEAESRQAFQYAHLYLGLWHEVNGRREQALAHIRRSAGEFSMPHYMGAVARTHLLLRAGTSD